MILLILIIFSYLLGSIPVGFLVGKFKKIDIRSHGSGNIGATNISRALGIKYAIFVGACDFLKGLIPAYIATDLFSSESVIIIIILAAIVGHIFPIFLKFKGGKGVATYSGALFILLGFKLFILVAILWLAFLYISKLMSLTNLALSLIIPLIFLILKPSGTYLFFSLLTTLLIWYTHRDNIKRLLNGSEKKLSLSFNK